MSELILYTSEHGRTRLDLRMDGQTVWLTQLEIAELFQTTKQDVIIAKNYLTEDEVDTLNRLVVIFLEQAELRAKKQQELTLDYWRTSVDRMLTANDQPLLKGPGNMSNEAMKTIAHDRYESFDSNRRLQEASQADDDDIKAIEALEKSLKRKGGGK